MLLSVLECFLISFEFFSEVSCSLARIKNIQTKRVSTVMHNLLASLVLGFNYRAVSQPLSSPNAAI